MLAKYMMLLSLVDYATCRKFVYLLDTGYKVPSNNTAKARL